ncbi:MAG: rhomboid family intramembrane serine protease [Candidatus Aenigmarchaeota archaeon]|nr:rhomboid family intramembrane serine protease [Candidatus Aenigmarchaeota archaeon]
MEKKYEKPKLTHYFIILCIIAYALQLFLKYYYGEDFFNSVLIEYGFSLQNILIGRIWVFLTSIFLHATPEHLVMNLIALYFFGKVVEQELGRKKFLLAFFASALIANLFIVVSTLLGYSSMTTPTVGASAAIFGLMGISMITKPLEFIFYPYLIPIPLVLVALIYTLFNVASFLLVLTGQISSNISYVSHVGGLVSGLLLGFREERSKKGFIIILFILFLLLTTPFIILIINTLENFNYINIILNIFR